MAFLPQAKSSMAKGFLLQEIADFILQENGGKIILQEVQEWAEETKHTSVFTSSAKHTSVWTPIIKH